MNIPQDGRIVVIDDKESEAIPLLKTLFQNGHPAFYFSEAIENLPKNPLPGIRLVFLDIVLGTDGQDSQKRIVTPIAVLQKIIDKHNGPFILVAWTMHHESIPELSQALIALGYQFLLVDLEKSDCKNGDGYSMEIIANKLKEKLDGKDALHLFTVWLNLVHQSSGKIVNDFSQLYPHDVDWDKNMANVFFHLAVGYAGEKVDRTNHDDVIRNALFSFNGAFLDSLAAEVRQNKYSDDIKLPFDNVSASLDAKTMGTMNSKLIVTSQFGSNTMPGNVFETMDIPKPAISELFNGNFELSENKTTLEQSVKNIVLEITPVCDYAQGKQKVIRLLPGVLWPEDVSSDKIDKQKWYIYKSPVIMFQDKFYYMVFDFRYLTSISMEKITGKTPIFTIRQEMLVDIQAHMASHTSRPGFVSVNKSTFS